MADSEFRLNYQKPLVLLGSCFADNIGQRLINTGWQASVNPCGVLYNPLSIADTLQAAIDGNFVPETHLHPGSGLTFSFSFSTKFSRPDAAQAIDVMKEGMAQLRNGLLTAQALIVTFGTSWVFRLKETGKVVANCHKLPADCFVRRCCSLQEMLEMWQGLLSRLKALNPDMKVIFTVSPVRHLADGFTGNMRSKARLLLLCEELAQLPQCLYFPAYEILNDDLRDYRFYADDLVHLSAMAADYIFNKFTDTFVPPSTLPLMTDALKSYRRSLHRPINPVN